jgi:hypothetical protein
VEVSGKFQPRRFIPGGGTPVPVDGWFGVGSSTGRDFGRKSYKKPLPLPEFETRTVALSSSLTKHLQVMLFYASTRDVGLTRGCMCSLVSIEALRWASPPRKDTPDNCKIRNFFLG